MVMKFSLQKKNTIKQSLETCFHAYVIIVEKLSCEKKEAFIQQLKERKTFYSVLKNVCTTIPMTLASSLIQILFNVNGVIRQSNGTIHLVNIDFAPKNVLEVIHLLVVIQTMLLKSEKCL